MLDTIQNLSEMQVNDQFDILKLIDAAGWPVFALIALIVFRKPIINLLNRLTKVGHGGTTLEATQQLVKESQEQQKISNIDRVLGLFRPETTDFFRSSVINESDLDSIKNDSEKAIQLLNYSTALYVLKYFETVYYSIFGSQILILQELTSSSKETLQTIKRYYDFAAGENPKFYSNYPFEAYIDFLFRFGLIVQNKNSLGITAIGIDFLKYLTESQKPLNKAL